MANARQRAKKRAEKAAAAAKAKAAAACPVCPVAAAEQAEKERVEKAYDKMAQNGHAVQRHGEAITQQQLTDRAVKGFDPVTGTKNDAYNKYPDGTPREHLAGKHATKFNDKAAMVKADETIRNSQKYKDELQKAKTEGKTQFAVPGTKLQDALGPDYKQKVTGVTRLGSKNNPTGSQPTDFTDGTIRAVYKKDAAGNWNVHTMFPEPKA
jgi:hypothetical protein